MIFFSFLSNKYIYFQIKFENSEIFLKMWLIFTFTWQIFYDKFYLHTFDSGRKHESDEKKNYFIEIVNQKLLLIFIHIACMNCSFNVRNTLMNNSKIGNCHKVTIISIMSRIRHKYLSDWICNSLQMDQWINFFHFYYESFEAHHLNHSEVAIHMHLDVIFFFLSYN